MTEQQRQTNTSYGEVASLAGRSEAAETRQAGSVYEYLLAAVTNAINLVG